MKHHKQNRSALLCAVLNSGLLIGCLSFGAAVHAAITFQFKYDDPAGIGFLDPAYGASRQAALNTAASTFSSMFGSHFSNSGTIILEASSTNDPLSGVMASAGSLVGPGPGTAGFNLAEVVRTKLQTGVDLNGNNADGVVNVNFGQAWELDFNTPASYSWDWYSGTYDFYSTLYHEFTHALGFSSTIQQSGDSMFGTPSWDTFDSFISDKHGNQIINPDTFTLNQAAWGSGSVGNYAGGDGSGEGLFFDGPNAVAANGGFLVTLYTPSKWDDGSSVSHLDGRMTGIGEMMMTPFTGTGPRTHDYSAVEVGILTDLGYVAVVPEPETYSMLLAGLAVCGWIARRRKIKNFE